MILKNITARKAALKTGLLFWITIELEDDRGIIHRGVMDLEKGLEEDKIVERIENLAQQIRDI